MKGNKTYVTSPIKPAEFDTENGTDVLANHKQGNKRRNKVYNNLQFTREDYK